jgi:hypothetical protein
VIRNRIVVHLHAQKNNVANRLRIHCYGFIYVHAFSDGQRFDGVMSSTLALFQPVTLGLAVRRSAAVNDSKISYPIQALPPDC